MPCPRFCGTRSGRSAVVRGVSPLPLMIATILPDRGVHLPLAPFTRLLVMTMLAKVGEDACFLALLLEALEGALEILILVNDDL